MERAHRGERESVRGPHVEEVLTARGPHGEVLTRPLVAIHQSPGRFNLVVEAAACALSAVVARQHILLVRPQDSPSERNRPVQQCHES